MIARPVAVAAGVSVAALALSLAPAGIARATGPEYPTLTQHQSVNVLRIVRHLPACGHRRFGDCKVWDGGRRTMLASFTADGDAGHPTYYVEVAHRHGHRYLTRVEVFR